MIKNARQYRLTKAQAMRFQHALRQLETKEGKALLSAALHEAERAALASQLETLRSEMADYEALLEGKGRTPSPASLDALPRTLIEARIVKGWSQKELAERLGMKEQQIQRYEATDYAGASLSRVQAIARLLGVGQEGKELASSS